MATGDGGLKRRPDVKGAHPILRTGAVGTDLPESEERPIGATGECGAFASASKDGSGSKVGTQNGTLVEGNMN